MKVYLVCDESGAKGYSDNAERFPGETGVFAGILITEDKIEKVRHLSKSIAVKYFNGGKYHLMSLPDEKKDLLRQEIYALILDNGITCIHDAIHVEGFHEQYKQRLSRKELPKPNSNIKTSNNIRTESLHAALFQGMFCKAVAYCIDTFSTDYELIILTDNVDAPILNDFNVHADEIIDFSPTVKTVKAYDISKDEPVTYTIKTSTDFSEYADMSDIADAQYSIEIEDKNSGLTLAADILSNSVEYTFKKRVLEDVGKPLNDQTSLQAHPLFRQFYGLIPDDHMLWTSDLAYMHPIERCRSKK